MSVVPRPVAARDGVLDELPAGARGLDLGRRGQVTDEGDLGDVAARRGAERTTRQETRRRGAGEAAG